MTRLDFLKNAKTAKFYFQGEIIIFVELKNGWVLVNSNRLYIANVTAINKKGIKWFNYTFDRRNSGFINFTELEITPA